MQAEELRLVLGGRSFPLTGRVRIGRDPALQVVLDDPKVSRVHATVWLQAGVPVVRDERSSNGTFVNEQRVPDGQVWPLRAGDRLRCGGSVLVVEAGVWQRTAGGWPEAAGQAGPGEPLAATERIVAGAPAAGGAGQARGTARWGLWAGLGCGLAALLVVCAGLGLALASGGAPIGTALAQLNPGAATAARAGATRTPPAGQGTPAEALATGAPGPAGTATATPGETPIAPVDVGPAPTLLAPQAALQAAAGLTGRVGALNQAELTALTVIEAKASQGELDQALVQVAARAMAVAEAAEAVGRTVAAQDGGSDAAQASGEDYASLARLGYSLVIETQNLRGALALGTLPPEKAAQVIAEFGARLWRPGFESSDTAAAANGAPLQDPFTPRAGGLAIAAVQPLDAAGAKALFAGLSAGTQLQSWLAVSDETITRTVWVPAFAPGRVPPPDFLDAALAAQLLTSDGQTDGEVARQAAAAHLRLLISGPSTAGDANQGGVLRNRGGGPAEGLVVPLLSRAVVALPPTPPAAEPTAKAPAGAAARGSGQAAPGHGGASLSRAGPGNDPGGKPNAQAGGQANPPAIPRGRLQFMGHSDIKVLVSKANVTQQNLPQVAGEVPVDQSNYLLPAKIEGVVTHGISGEGVLAANDIGLGIKITWDASRSLSHGEIGLACSASPAPNSGGVSSVPAPIDAGGGLVALIVTPGKTYTVQCFLIAGTPTSQRGNERISGMVLGATQIFGVTVPGIEDRDHDGVPDNEEKCPDEPEDLDQVADADGCPEVDADGDGILDLPDACPELAGDPPDGCPPKDTDGDGIPDYKDDCPAAAEDFDKVFDSDGCPETDGDGDHILDEVDKCPEQAEDFDGFQDSDGCPDFDNDQDGIYDSYDLCPNEPETKNGYIDEDGCPDTLPVFTAAGNMTESADTKDGVHFTFNTALNITIDYGTLAVGGTLNGVGSADVEFTCYNIDNPSEIYDRATVTYAITYQAIVSGSTARVGGLATVPITPAGNITGKLTKPYTDEHCTHYNSGTPPNQGGFAGTGTVTVLTTDTGVTTLTVDWKTDGWTSFGSWDGVATVK